MTKVIDNLAVQDDLNTLLSDLENIDTSVMAGGQVLRLAKYMTVGREAMYKAGATNLVRENGRGTESLQDAITSHLLTEYNAFECSNDADLQKGYASCTNALTDAGKVAFPVYAEDNPTYVVGYDGILLITFKTTGSRKEADLKNRKRECKVEFLTATEVTLLTERAQQDADIKAERKQEDTEAEAEKAEKADKVKQAERDNMSPADVWAECQNWLAENHPHVSIHAMLSVAMAGETIADGDFKVVDVETEATGTNG